MLLELSRRICGEDAQPEKYCSQVGEGFHVRRLAVDEIASEQDHVRQFVRQRGDNCQWVFQLRTLDSDYEAGLICGADVEARWPPQVAMPKGHDGAKFVGLIRKHFEVDLPFIDLHITAYSLEEHVHCLIRPVVRIGKMFGYGKDNLGVNHPCSSQQF